LIRYSCRAKSKIASGTGHCLTKRPLWKSASRAVHFEVRLSRALNSLIAILAISASLKTISVAIARLKTLFGTDVHKATVPDSIESFKVRADLALSHL
jgi:hypothetical protein